MNHPQRNCLHTVLCGRHILQLAFKRFPIEERHVALKCLSFSHALKWNPLTKLLVKGPHKVKYQELYGKNVPRHQGFLWQNQLAKLLRSGWTQAYMRQELSLLGMCFYYLEPCNNFSLLFSWTSWTYRQNEVNSRPHVNPTWRADVTGLIVNKDGGR